MANKHTAELLKKSEAELAAEAARLQKERFDIEFKHSTRQLADTMSIRKTRKQIARALTLKNAAKKAASK